MLSQVYFVTGTDTGVGKTLVTAALCATLVARGVKAAAFKPLESGCAPQPRGLGRHLKRADTLFLKKMSGMRESVDEINPYFFREALAPGIAAEREGMRILFARIGKGLDALRKKYDVVFVEGAGGLMVPVSGRKTNVDLIKFINCPVIVVARLGLGTINHTLLTLHHLKESRIRISGVILNETVPRTTIAEKTNPEALKKRGVQVVGVFPFLKKRTRKTLIAAAEKTVPVWLDRIT